jgi:TonB-linked SusC/RagA family outer membrane protein
MKKNLLNLIPLNKSGIKKILLTMKLALIIVFISVLQVSATVYSQINVNLDVHDKSIREVLKSIEQQTQVRFFFSDDLFVMNDLIDIKADNENIIGVLENIFSESPLTFKAYANDLIVIAPKELIQDNKVSGTVTDKSGTPLPGVNVVVTGSTQGTITDINGKYSIEVPRGGVSLTFSFIGMDPQIVTIGALTQINVKLEEAALRLDEVVVVGYGTQTKAMLTSSVGTVNSAQLKDRAVLSFTEAMVGQLAGVQIQQTTGAPGGGFSIKIRGTGSITSGSQPLYVVDGVPIDNVITTQAVMGWTGQQAQNPMASINPNDIQSIDILKDASSTAIYGSRGSNGVILITTKQGVAGKPVFSLNVSRGVQTVAKKVDMMNLEEYIEMETDRRNHQWVLYGSGANRQLTDPNSVRSSTGYKIPVEFSDPSNFKGTDWQDELFEVAPMVLAQLSVSGGTDKTRYYLSGDVVDQDGVLLNTGFKKFSLRTNVDTEISKRVKMGFKVNPSYNISNMNQAGGYGGTIAHGIMNLTPTYDAYNEDGTYSFYSPRYTYGDGTFTYGVFGNPVAKSLETDMVFDQIRLLSSAYISIDIMKNLVFKSTISTDINSFSLNQFTPSTTGAPGTVWVNGSLTSSRNMNWVNENTVTYTNTFSAKHNLSVLGGVTEQKSYFEYHDIYADGFPNDNVHTLNAGTVYDGGQTRSEWSLLSVLGRVNYDYDKKYLFTGTLRTDGSSRFGSENKWGVFPSASVGWRISQESFMENVEQISELKLRVSYGVTGNNDISNYGSIGSIGGNNYILGSGSGTIVNGLVQNSISNRNLGWEQTKELDLGFELGLFQDRVYLNADYYNSLTTGLLLDVPVPLITGFSTALQNIGEVRNRGIELSVETRNIATNDLKWNTNFNISFNRNVVESMGLTDAPIIVGPRNFFNELAYITKVGEPIGSFYGYISEGVYMTQTEADADPAKFPLAGAGDLNFKDISGPDGVPDGVLNSLDQTVIGNNQPDFIYGLTNTVTYKGFDLNLTIQGVQGNQVMMGQLRNTYRWFAGQNRDYWKSEAEPGDGNTFRPGGINQNRNVSTWWLEDGSFLRFKNLTLGYNIPVEAFGSVVNRARVYLTAENLFTITKYPGFNPEINSGEGDDYNQLTPGLDFGGYPVSRTITIGINMSF